MNLNIPDIRQQRLAQRLQAGDEIVAADAAAEFDVSVDTIRRDILALEAEGKAHRVRGGAVPVTAPSSPLHIRLASAETVRPDLIRAALGQIGDAKTLLMDGGTTTLSLVAQIPPVAGLLIITPSPWIAIACQERGIEAFLLGGMLSAQGGIATGETALAKVAGIAADIAILGACGVEASFGLSSDHHGEAAMKRSMQAAARRTVVVTDSGKIGRRARHQTLALSEIDQIITDADDAAVAALVAAGACVTTVLARS